MQIVVGNAKRGGEGIKETNGKSIYKNKRGGVGKKSNKKERGNEN